MVCQRSHAIDFLTKIYSYCFHHSYNFTEQLCVLDWSKLLLDKVGDIIVLISLELMLS